MLSQERYAAILKIVNERKAVTVAELTEMLDTSESTVRRDLTVLDKNGKLKKVFGGATSLHQLMETKEDYVNVREQLNVKEKKAIAKYAAEQINDNDFVYIDAGTTTAYMIEYINNTKATFVTNGIVHAKMLAAKMLKVYIIGGTLKSTTEAIIGVEGMMNLRKYNFTKCFMGTNGIDIDCGFTTPDAEEAMIKSEAMKRSYVCYVLADHTKFSKVYPVSFSDVNDACVITNTLPDKKYLQITVIKEVSI